MLYHSLSSPLSGLSLKQALLSSGASSSEILTPDRLPVLPRAFFNNCSEMRAGEISYVVNNMLFSSDLPSSAIKEIVDTSLSFPLPLTKIEENIYALELFHGPTMSIKDIPARFTARMLPFLGVKELNIVMATTGNNGSAIANSIQHNRDFHVFVLFPKSTPRSIVARFTAPSGNVHAIEVDGNFSDCQRILKSIHSDKSIKEVYSVATPGSVNPGMILPLIFIYMYAYAQATMLSPCSPGVQFSIPMANGGALSAALMAKQMGLPMLPPIAARASSHPCTAYALDIERPANLPRVDALSEKVIYDAVSNSKIADTINDVYARTGYTFDPNSAAAYSALKDNLSPGAVGVVLATAHPALSIDKMTEITGRAIELPLSLTRFMGVESSTIKIPPTYPAFKRYLSKYINF